jgi:hypothetical protein
MVYLFIVEYPTVFVEFRTLSEKVLGHQTSAMTQRFWYAKIQITLTIATDKSISQ